MKKQLGFGLLEGLLVFIGITFIVFAGWYVINQNNSKTDDSNMGNSDISNIDGDIVKPDKETFLTIKEWGVQIPLSPAINGAYYKLDDSFEQSTTNPTSLIIYSEEADSITGSGGVSCKGEYVAYLQRFQSVDPYWQSDESALFDVRADIGTYRYAIATDKSYGPRCFEKNPESNTYEEDMIVVESFNKLVELFVSDFRNIALKN